MSIGSTGRTFHMKTSKSSLRGLTNSSPVTLTSPNLQSVFHPPPVVRDPPRLSRLAEIVPRRVRTHGPTTRISPQLHQLLAVGTFLPCCPSVDLYAPFVPHL